MVLMPEPAVTASRLALVSLTLVNPVCVPKLPVPPVGSVSTFSSAAWVASLQTSVGLVDAHTTVGNEYTVAVVLVLFLQPLPSV